MVCSSCKILYREIANLGAWKCTEYRIYNYNTGRWVKIAGDHGGPYAAGRERVVVPPGAMQWLVDVNPRAVKAARATVQHGAAVAIAVYENRVVSRYDTEEYERVRTRAVR